MQDFETFILKIFFSISALITVKYFHVLNENLPFHIMWIVTVFLTILTLIYWTKAAPGKIKQLKPRLGLAEAFLLLFVLWALFSGFFSPDPLDAIKRCVGWLIMYFFFFQIAYLILRNKGSSEIAQVFSCIYLVYFLIIVISLILLFVDPFSVTPQGFINPRVNSGRFLGIYGNANHFGDSLIGFFNIGILCSLFYKKKMILLMTLCLALPLVVLIGSRSVMLAIGVSAFLWIITSKKKLLLGTPVLLLSFGAFVLCRDFIYDLVFRTQIPEALDFRFVIWRTLVQYIVEHRFILGVGLGNTDDLMSKFWPEGTWSAHNSFVDIFVGSGFIGFVLFFLFIYFLFARVLKTHLFTRKKQLKEGILHRSLFIIFVSYLIQGFFTDTYKAPTVIGSQLMLFSYILSVAYFKKSLISLKKKH